MTDTNKEDVPENTAIEYTTIKENPSQYVKLNVGGYLYCSTVGTLTKHDTMLRAMFTGQMEVIRDSEGYVLIDRCGKHFGTILNFLRDGNVSLPETDRELAELHAEAQFYCIAELAEACDPDILKRNRKAEQICKVSLTKSREEGKLLISSTTKPAIKLILNPNNRSFINSVHQEINSLYKNMELFDQLSLKYGNHILFIKDTVSLSEACCWEFYQHGNLVSCITFFQNNKFDYPEENRSSYPFLTETFLKQLFARNSNFYSDTTQYVLVSYLGQKFSNNIFSRKRNIIERRPINAEQDINNMWKSQEK